jgi:hypothetical protein
MAHYCLLVSTNAPDVAIFLPTYVHGGLPDVLHQTFRQAEAWVKTNVKATLIQFEFTKDGLKPPIWSTPEGGLGYS